jgi:trehalose utilization protein
LDDYYGYYCDEWMLGESDHYLFVSMFGDGHGVDWDSGHTYTGNGVCCFYEKGIATYYTQYDDMIPIEETCDSYRWR